MSDPNTTSQTIPDNPSQTLGSGWMNNVRGADLDLDMLFQSPENTPPQVAPPAPSQPPSQTSEVFLKTSTGTVYKDADAAIKGIEEKDRVIAQLRAQAAAASGVDPLKKQSSTTTSAPDPATQRFQDLVDSAGKADAAKYVDTIGHIAEDRFSPYAPLLAEVARERALRLVEAEVPGVREFVNSPEYMDAVSAIPTLKQAIEMVEGNPASAGQLPDLYKAAYLIGKGRRVGEPISTPATPVQIPRPTLTSTTPTPPPPQAAQPTGDPLASAASRKDFIKSFESRGGLDRVF